MQTQDFRLQKLKKGEPIPFDLLLLADETEEAIKKYIYHSDIYTVYYNARLNPIGVFALYRVSNLVMEIKNIGISGSFRGIGIGSFLIKKIKEIAAKENFKEVIAGAPDNGIREIRFYEKNGFRIYAAKKNFFTENSSKPIIENGSILTDMVMLGTTV